MRGAYKGIAQLIALGVALQAATIALGWFIVIGDLDDGKTLTEDWEYNIGHATHAVIGLMVMPLLGLVLFILSFFAKVPSGVKWAGLLFAAIVVQVALAFVSFGVPLIGALHGLNALLVLGLALAAARQATPVVAASERTGVTAAV